MDIVEDNGNDSIAILGVISTFLVERILVDDGSAVEVLMWKFFKEMGLDENQLKPTGIIYDFFNQSKRHNNTLSNTWARGAYGNDHC